MTFNFDEMTDFEDDSNSFSPEQMQAIMLLAAGHKNTEVARRLETTSTRINGWMQDSTFRLAVKIAISNMLGDTLSQAVRESAECLEYLVSVRDNEDESTRNRMQATKEIITLAVNYRETIMEERLARVEKHIDENEA